LVAGDRPGVGRRVVDDPVDRRRLQRLGLDRERPLGGVAGIAGRIDRDRVDLVTAVAGQVAILEAHQPGAVLVGQRLVGHAGDPYLDPGEWLGTAGHGDARAVLAPVDDVVAGDRRDGRGRGGDIVEDDAVARAGSNQGSGGVLDPSLVL